MDAANIVALVGAIVGSGGLSALFAYVLGGRNERKRDERAAERDVAALRERQGEDARTFQRDTVLELHDLLFQLNRVTGKWVAADVAEFEQTGRYGHAIPEGVSLPSSDLIVGINRLRVRLFDPELRGLVKQYTNALINATNPFRGADDSVPREQGDDQRVRERVLNDIVGSTRLWAVLEERLGAEIRALFPGSDLARAPGGSTLAERRAENAGRDA